MKVAKIILEDRAGEQRDYTGWVHEVFWDEVAWGVRVVADGRTLDEVRPIHFKTKKDAEIHAARVGGAMGAKCYSLTKTGIFADIKQ
jgi:hypothetical protein